MRSFAFVIIAYIVLAVLAFGKLPQTFFQQDEWAIFGNIIYADKAGISFFDRLFVYEQDTHLIPLSNLVTLLQYRLFGLNFPPYAWSAIVFHFINSLLVFYLAKSILRSFWGAFLAGGLFLVNSITHQPVTWVATTVGTVGSTLFLLISLILFQSYCQTDKKARLFLSLAVFAVSLGFKETSIFLFFYLPVFWLIMARRRSKANRNVLLTVLVITGTIYVGIRAFFFINAPPSSSPPGSLTQPSRHVYVYRAIVTPLKALSQSYLPERIVLRNAEELVLLAYPQFVREGRPDPYLVGSIASDIVSFAISVLIVFCVLAFFRSPASMVSIAFIALSSLPYIVIPGKAGYFSLLDGRHLYVTAIFSSILLAFIFTKLLNAAGKYRFLKIPLITFLLLLFPYHLAKVRNHINEQVVISQLRQSILRTISSSYPTLDARTVFFVESDKSYSGLPEEETIVPFQSGFGQTLLAWYHAQGQSFPVCFFKDKFLYVQVSQEYKECEGRGFGYFRKKSTFNEALGQYRFKPEEVFAFRFASFTNTFEDTTAQVRQTLINSGRL